MATNLPGLITYGTVNGTIVQAVSDSADSNTHPDSVPATGTVTFTPSVAFLSVPDPVSPEIVGLSAQKVSLDANGSFSVELVATNNQAITPYGWTWTISFNLIGVSVSSYSFSVAGGATTDISSVAPLVSNPGAIVVPGPTNVYVQQSNPSLTSPGMWVQTGLGSDGHGLTIWIEDGL